VQGFALKRSLKEALRLVLSRRLHAPRPRFLHPSAKVPLPPLPQRSLRGHHLYSLQVEPLPMYNHQLDRNTMSVALEARNPFLDYRVVECGLALEPDEHVHAGYTKWTLREAIRDLLPPEVVDRARKQGFSTDERDWMRGRLGQVMEETFRSEATGTRPYFDQGALLQLLAEHRAGADHAILLWRAFVVERWLELYIDPAAIAAPPAPDNAPTTTRSARDAVVRLDELEPSELPA
jgi:asparagine synthetase B (glutamine-hydrolysing)